ncbi:hypothetical protein RUM44_002373 [Polyplax serrata]|uniref:NADH dehydrogenase [ubiquinone] 1 beta subcomplex subunit 9 n=1 Tax=Polyplax serrata TaxID=468196 RepID=A0ABR1AMM7_POLSC
MPVVIPFNLVSHHRKIANLYKKEEKRYRVALLRAEFDEIYCEKDMRKSKQMLIEKQAQMKKRFCIPQVYFPDSPQGVAFERQHQLLDAEMDLWHPLEKAIYPEYFAKREMRKQQYIEMWDKIHGPPPVYNEDNIEEDHSVM